MPTDAQGRYGDCNDDTARGIPPSASPKGIVRMPGRDDSDALARAIAQTGCTLTEVLNAGNGVKVARVIFSWRDDTVAAMAILKKLGYEIDLVMR